MNDISCKRIRMAVYEPVKVHDDEHFNKNYVSLSNNVDDEDVELALRFAKVNDAAYKAMEEKKSLILSANPHQHQQQQQQRLVSLDVFRGLTVAVIFRYHNFFFIYCLICLDFMAKVN